MDTTDTAQTRNRATVPTTNENEPPLNPDDEFNFDRYDEEESAQVAGIGDVVAIDPEHNLDDEAEDSEAEDDLIKPTDNLVLVGHVDDDSASLEVFGNRIVLPNHYVYIVYSFVRLRVLTQCTTKTKTVSMFTTIFCCPAIRCALNG